MFYINDIDIVLVLIAFGLNGMRGLGVVATLSTRGVFHESKSKSKRKSKRKRKVNGFEFHETFAFFYFYFYFYFWPRPFFPLAVATRTIKISTYVKSQRTKKRIDRRKRIASVC